MAPSSRAPDPLPRRNGWERLLLTLLSVAVCLGLAWYESLREARRDLSGAGRAVQPLLTRMYPDSLPERLPGFEPEFRLSIFLADGERILAPGSVPPGSFQPPPLDRTATAFVRDGWIFYLFPVHESGEPPANAVLSRPLRSLWPSTFWKTGFLLLAIGLYRLYRHRRTARAAIPREQLLEEIQALRADSIDRKVSLPLDNPFKPVADTMNQLLAARERKDRQLNEQHHQQQILLNNMSEGILTLDNDLRVTGLNPAAANWLNLDNPQRIRGEIFYTVCRNPKLLRMIEGVGGAGSLQEEFLRLERPGREDRIVKVKGSPLIDRDQTMGVLLVLQDVTTLRRLETLRQDFVANVTHELRTPLTAIKGYAEIMAEEPDLPDPLKNHTTRILAQSGRMVNIIEDLLSLTRIETAEDQPPFHPTALRPFMESVVRLCEESLEMRNLKAVVECPEDLTLPLHPPLFEQALHNLLHNAIKYTHPDTTITLRGLDRETRVRIEVADEGPGIPGADQSRIFERFYRVDKARSRAIGGTGLGLSIVKHITFMHQGELGVESTLGEGATFWIEVPKTFR